MGDGAFLVFDGSDTWADVAAGRHGLPARLPFVAGPPRGCRKNRLARSLARLELWRTYQTRGPTETVAGRECVLLAGGPRLVQTHRGLAGLGVRGMLVALYEAGPSV